MKLMDKLMGSMIGKMSLQQKQEMMLKMMPMMMQDVNMAETMLKMMPTMADQISLLDLLKVLKKIFPELLEGINTVSEFVSKLKTILPEMIEKLPLLMEKMMPLFEIMMPAMMGYMMPLVFSAENMDKFEKFPQKMLPKMLENENVRTKMPEMMIRMMPHCLEHMLPYLPDTERKAFTEKLKSILDRA